MCTQDKISYSERFHCHYSARYTSMHVRLIKVRSRLMHVIFIVWVIRESFLAWN